jgi:hypothetical protein
MSGDSLGRDGPRYDAFVVRLWRDASTGLCGRAEVEHVRTGALTRAAEVPTEWGLDQIIAHLGASTNLDVATRGRRLTAESTAP